MIFTFIMKARSLSYINLYLSECLKSPLNVLFQLDTPSNDDVVLNGQIAGKLVQSDALSTHIAFVEPKMSQQYIYSKHGSVTIKQKQNKFVSV